MSPNYLHPIIGHRYQFYLDAYWQPAGEVVSIQRTLDGTPITVSIATDDVELVIPWLSIRAMEPSEPVGRERPTS